MINYTRQSLISHELLVITYIPSKIKLNNLTTSSACPVAAPDFSKAFNQESRSSSELKPSLKSVIKNIRTQNDHINLPLSITPGGHTCIFILCLLKTRLNLSTSWTVEEAGNFYHGIPILKTSCFTLQLSISAYKFSRMISIYFIKEFIVDKIC